MFFDNLFDNVFDPFFDDDFFASRHPHHPMIGPGQKKDMGLMSVMRTDVKENDKDYELIIDLPGYAKDDVKAKLDNGHLTISAERTIDKVDNFDKNGKARKNGKFIRKERYSGSVSRSWYVGEDIKQGDIKANFKDGVLTITIPKVEPKKELPDQDKYILIEG